MFRFGIENLRRLEHVPAIELRPITVLVGRNSSGKSTFLRALPLLRQSVTTRTSAPILWFGNWVDFGDFDRAVLNNSSDLPITFLFGIDEIQRENSIYFDEEMGTYHRSTGNFKNVLLKVSIIKTKSGTRISSLILEEESNNVEFQMHVSDQATVTSLTVDGSEMINALEGWRLNISPASIFPTVRIMPDEPFEVGASINRRPWDQHPIMRAVGELIAPMLDKRVKGESLGRLVELLSSLDVISKEAVANLSGKDSNRSWGKLVRDVGGADKNSLYPKLRSLLLIMSLVKILNSTAAQLKLLVGSILYIGPARAKSDRYYRYQDLSVSEIDPDGQNFPMFLNSLSDTQIQRFSKWVQDLFGYGVKVGRESGHITINLVYESGTVNVVDTGYGVSQILPVLGQIWWANNKPRNSNRFARQALILAIEQPELHLHPAHQALLADAFVSGYQSRNRASNESGTHFVLETHSETMINRLGALIAEGKIVAQDVQILLFNADNPNDGRTQVEQVFFDDEGQLVNWPYEFFLPTV